MAPTILLADIGGTTTRIARAGRDGAPFDVRMEANDGYGGLEELFGAYLATLGAERPRAGVFAIAGPVDGDDIRMTNRSWSFNRPALARALGLDALAILNDFAALAHGIPTLGREHLVRVGAGHDVPGAPILVCGPGTGLGTATLLPRRDGTGFDVLPGEGGHVRLGAVTADEARVIAHLVRDLGPVSVEHVVSGPGLVRLHRILSGETASSHAIIQAALGGHRRELDTCHVFLRVLGRIAGDFCLLTMARGGVFIAGGVGAAMAPLFAGSPFRAAFEDHPPYHEHLANVRVEVVVHPTPGLAGAAEVGRRLLAAD
ncbi:glucokinase [Aquabacter spiritensis]|uniref:Glucokinase n=1 Tax=Aquabacter spiritensis TaxID=933073 RepID=A0A4R3M0N5_9HYPH|nr:glucokinase [Aquabacter spiritensis]TCT06590.1 glucokinase [Aquabacter spiritensis]